VSDTVSGPFSLRLLDGGTPVDGGSIPEPELCKYSDAYYYFNATAGAGLEPITAIFVPQGSSSSGAWFCRLRTWRLSKARSSRWWSPAAAPAGRAAVRNGCLEWQCLLAFIEEEIQVGILQAAVVILEP